MEKQVEEQKASLMTAGESPQASSQRKGVVLSSGQGGILGIKAGMTQVYGQNGEALAVTVIDLKPTIVTQVKTQEKNGYQAVQVGLLEKKLKSVSKPERGHVQASGAPGFYHYQEFRINGSLDGIAVGDLLLPAFLKEGDLIDLTAKSKGKGFQGGMKRYHMGGGHKSHGASLSHRQLGSIGNRADPAKCFKNKKMAGHMGHVRVTTQNVRVVRIDTENQLLLVHGSVPGPRSGIVSIRRSIKRLAQQTQENPVKQAG